MKRNEKLFLIVLAVLFFSCLSVSMASDTGNIAPDNSQNSFEAADCQMTGENQFDTDSSAELTKSTHKSSAKEVGEVSVNGYGELANQIKSIQQGTQRNHVINLQPGNYTATETITLKQVNGTGYSLTINGNNLELDGQNTYQFLKVVRCSVELRNITLRNFYSNNNGGAINLYYSNCSITDSTLMDNSAKYQGGAIFAISSNYNISGTTLIGNSADKGGAIYATYSNSTVSGSGFINNTANDGGAVYASNSPNNIMDTEMTDNMAQHSGGAIYAYRSENRIADTILAGNTAELGSAIWISDAYATATGITVTDNRAQTRGSIYIYRSNATIVRSTISNNMAEYGAAIFTFNSKIRIIETGLNNNTADTLGGAVCVYNSNVTINDTTLADNGADSGGAIYLSESNVQTSNTSLTCNTATNMGGAIYLNGSNIITANTSLTCNTATNMGGAIYSLDSGNVIANTTLSNNLANDSGGALFALNSRTNITDSILTGNTATNMGGAICYKSSELAIINTTFNGNKAREGNDTYGYKINTSIVFNTISEKEYGDSLTFSGFIKGNNQTIKGIPLKLDVYINGMKRALTTSDKGRFSTTVKLNATGIWEATAVFKGQDDYQPCNASTSCNVSKRNTILKMNVSDLFLNREATLTGYLTDKINTKLRNANIYVTVNGIQYHMLTDGDGRYTLNYTPTVLGTNNLTVLYKGNRNYGTTSLTASFEVGEDIVVRSTCYRDNITVTALLTKGNETLGNRKANLTINGETTTVNTDADGIIHYVCTSKSAGNNILEITCGNQVWTQNFTTQKRNTTLTLDAPQTASINNAVCISGILKDHTGTILKNANIYIKVGNLQYHVMTDNSGAYALKYTPTAEGRYKITVTYKGNKNYNLTALEKSITIS